MPLTKIEAQAMILRPWITLLRFRMLRTVLTLAFAMLGVVEPSSALEPQNEPQPAQEVVSSEVIAKRLARKTRSAPVTRRTTRGFKVVEVDVVSGSAMSFANIRFVINSTDFADETSNRQIKEIAKAMDALPPGEKFLIEGHTCDLGTDEHNKQLSEKRADKVCAALVALGVRADRLLALGFGESEVPQTGLTEKQRAQHRKVVIYKCAP